MSRAKSTQRVNANLPKTKKEYLEDIPVWLNSFLSILVPSCFLDPFIPNLEKEYKKKLRERNKKHQIRVIRYQIITSTLIILTSVGLICYAINCTDWAYNYNIFNNLQFNTFCAILGAMGLTSFLFVFMNAINVYDILNMKDHGEEVEEFTVTRKRKTLGEDETDNARLEPGARVLNRAH